MRRFAMDWQLLARLRLLSVRARFSRARTALGSVLAARTAAANVEQLQIEVGRRLGTALFVAMADWRLGQFGRLCLDTTTTDSNVCLNLVLRERRICAGSIDLVLTFLSQTRGCSSSCAQRRCILAHRGRR